MTHRPHTRIAEDRTPFNGMKPAELHLTAEEDAHGHYTGRHTLAWYDPEKDQKFYKTFGTWSEAVRYLTINIVIEF